MKMNKKSFIFLSLGVALLLFSSLALLNYRADMTRILHHDYTHVYKGIHPNKLFLKTVYLLDNKEKYDTIVYGSSRGGFVDVSLISPKAYNMSHGFGTVTTYLDNLKTLLGNNIKIKNVWISINDFVIWKDQTNSLVNMAYHNGLFGNIPLYTDWLFELRSKNVKILTDNIPLVKSNYIINPQEKVKNSRKKEKILSEKRNIPPTTLGYTGIFRIDSAIKEVKDIKEICKKNNIHLTIFFYPTYYKTYFRYNQYKIEEFKRKLASIIDFYDFYDVGRLSINKKNWFEGSHFTPSVGDYIIKNIQQGKGLVTSENIESRIQETRSYIKNLASVDLLPPGKSAYHYNSNINLDPFPIIFDITKNDITNISNAKQSTHSNKNTPVFIIKDIHTQAKQIVLTTTIESKSNANLRLFFKDSKDTDYNPRLTYQYKLKKGLNEIRIVILGKYINNDMKVQIPQTSENFKIDKFILQSLQ